MIQLLSNVSRQDAVKLVQVGTLIEQETLYGAGIGYVDAQAPCRNQAHP